MKWSKALGVPAAALGAVAAYDLTQKKHALLRNFPVIGHGRYLLERVGPELRQYIVTSNDQERPFSRDQRSWVYASAKGQNNYFGFGSDNDMEFQDGYAILKHKTFLSLTDGSIHHDENESIPAIKVLGGPRGRRGAFRPASVVNISGMSYGSLSAAAVEALNRGAAEAGCLQNTGEGGLTPHHQHGADVVWQIGTAYFGCRTTDGRFDITMLKDRLAEAPEVKAIEIKLSQGAKPGLGGMLPAAKISAEIAEIRGIPVDQDCASPARHTAFTDTDSMLDFVEWLADETGLPVGIKSAVGNLDFWGLLIGHMGRGDRGVDFITIDGGEGGTGAAPLIFSDSVAFPFRVAFSRVYSMFAEAGLTDDVFFVGSGKLGLPDNATVAFALGCDSVSVGREAMLSIGCIQSQKCHTDKCPTGVATQDPWLTRGVDPTSKAQRCANYIRTLRRDLLKVSEACGVPHPTLLSTDDIELVHGTWAGETLREVYGYQEGWGQPGADLVERFFAEVGDRTNA